MNEWIAVSCANKLEKAKEALEAANKRIKELEAANENCISLSLHESRMFGAEQREKQLQSQNATLMAQVKIYRDALEYMTGPIQFADASGELNMRAYCFKTMAEADALSKGE